mgnify:CR=1 FL=1
MATTADFVSPDIHCQKCAGRVREALSRNAGISKIEVDPAAHKVHVEFDAATVSVNQIHDALVDAGYPPIDSK